LIWIKRAGRVAPSRVAEREGFEPSIRFPVYTLSKRAPSTTRPPLRKAGAYNGGAARTRTRQKSPVLRARKTNPPQQYISDAMIRFLFRFIGLWLLAGAFAALVIDGTRSVAASALTITSVRDAWELLNPAGLSAAQKQLAAAPWNQALAFLLNAPLWILLAAVGLILLALGRRRRTEAIGYSSRD
jgi:hypothetical protein